MKNHTIRKVQAQQVAGEIMDTRAAACLGQAQWWSSVEAAHKKARGKVTATAAAAPAMRACAQCPVIGLCGDLAALDHYTGLAAGGAWTDGRKRYDYVGVDLLQAS
jgi:hypothetical protein